MNFEVKRVLIGFEHGLFEKWPGYQNENKPIKCSSCNCTGKSNRYIELKSLYSNKYTFFQQEINFLFEKNLLKPFSKPPTPTELYEKCMVDPVIGSKHEELLIARRLKVEGKSDKCDQCNGLGNIWSSEEARELDLEWEPTDPDEGICYQIWAWDGIDKSTNVPITRAYICKTDLLKELISDEFSLKLDRALKLFNADDAKEFYLGSIIIEVQNALD